MQDQSYNQAPPNYQQNMPPPMNGSSPTPAYTADHKGEFTQAFKLEKPKWNDLWALILLLLTFAGFVGISALVLSGYAAHRGQTGGGINNGSASQFGLSSNTMILFAFVLMLAFVLSYAYMWGARVFTKQFIYISFIFQVVMGLATAIIMIARKYYVGGIIFLLFTVFYIFCFFSWRKRIPFSVLMLQTVIDVAKQHGHVFMVSFIGGVIATMFGAWFSVTLVGVYQKYSVGSPACTSSSGCGSAKVIGLIVFITFAGYWISEFIKNVIHTTVCGVYGSWFFMGGKPGGMPKGSTRGAARRALTYSAGSIAFGSLITALIQLLRQALSVASQTAAQDGNVVAVVLLCFVQCIVGFMDWAVQFFNEYAYTHIALYGKAYIPAAKDTWTMIKTRGIDALINDCLISPVLTMGATAIAYTCSFLAYLYLEFTNPAYNDEKSYTPVVMAFAFLIGLQIANIFLVPLKSGTATLFVAMAWDPEVLMTDHADLYQRMVAVYPQVQQAIHA